MKVLLVSMPQATSALQRVIRVPNLGICSLAGNLDGCDTRCLDLSLYQGRITPLLQHIMRAFGPDVVGMTAMSHQYECARRVALICKSIKPQALTVLGGAHVTALAEEISESGDRELFDFLIRGEGERTLNSLVRELRKGKGKLTTVKGLSFLCGNGYVHNPPAPVTDLDDIRLPDRDSRILEGPRFGLPLMEAIETSRLGGSGGKRKQAMRFFSLERVVDDLRTIVERRARAAFYVDQDMAADTERLRELCELIEGNKLQSLITIMRVRVESLTRDPQLPRFLARAGVRSVILDMDGGLEGTLPAARKAGSADPATAVVRALQQERIAVVGELSLGSPDDTRESVRETWRYAARLGMDHTIMRVLTPYPKTEARDRLIAEGLVTNINDYTRYTGFLVNVRTRHLSTEELTRELVLAGARLYFSPRYFLRSRLWWGMPPGAPVMLALNVRFVSEGLRGKMFYRAPNW